MTTITVNVPAAVAAPRGAALVALVYSTIASGLTLWRHARKARRAAGSRAAEAAEVRAYAAQMMKQDHRYAADLLAAADRHEAS